MYVLPAFSFPVRFPDFYVESWSLYAEVSVLLSKWRAFYSEITVWVRTHERHPVRPPEGEGFLFRVRSALHKTRGRGGFGWVSLRSCAQCELCAKYLLRQTQSQTRRSVRFPGLQGTWYLRSVDHLGLRPHDRDFDPSVNPNFNVRNDFIHFC